MKGIIKANTVDKYLYPIREQIIDFVSSGSAVIDYGCGNGDLLFKLSNKISSGIGIDNNEALISYAKKHKNANEIENISFEFIDLIKNNSYKKTDYSIASLLFHVIPRSNSIKFLKEIIKNSEITIICSFCKPENLRQSFILWVDQLFSGHYSNYKKYKEGKYMTGLLKEVSGISYSCHDTFDPVIKIYKIKKL